MESAPTGILRRADDCLKPRPASAKHGEAGIYARITRRVALREVRNTFPFTVLTREKLNGIGTSISNGASQNRTPSHQIL